MDAVTAVAAAAARAGVSRWWGAGPRPLNIPGSVPNAQSRHIAELRGDMYARAWGQTRVSRATANVVLEPTPAQLAAGVRVLEIADHDAYGPIAVLAEKARVQVEPWGVVIAQSRYLKDGTSERIVQSLRVRRDPVRAWHCWEFTVETARWGAQGGMMGFLVGSGIVARTPVNVTQLEELITGIHKERKPRKARGTE